MVSILAVSDEKSPATFITENSSEQEELAETGGLVASRRGRRKFLEMRDSEKERVRIREKEGEGRR